MNIEAYAISGIVIIVPDIPVTLILDQLILIHLNICHATGMSQGPKVNIEGICYQCMGYKQALQMK